MLYIIGLTLAFIFGCLIGREWQRWAEDDAKPLDLDITERDLLGGDTTPQKLKAENSPPNIDWINTAIFYPHKGRGMWN